MSVTSLAANRPHARKRLGYAVALTTLALALGTASPGIGKNDDHDSNTFVGDPDTNGNIHLKFYSYSIRQRLIDQNGTPATR